MIKDAYCSLEIAKLLKEKGFREVCHRYYNAQFDEIRTVSDTFMMDFNDNDFMKRIAMKGAISIPTHQMVLAWLRKKGIYIEIRHSFAEYGDKPQFFGVIYSKDEEFDKKSACFLRMKDKYEDAVEGVIKYILITLTQL